MRIVLNQSAKAWFAVISIRRQREWANKEKKTQRKNAIVLNQSDTACLAVISIWR